MTSYLSTQEVADRLGVSVFTIRRYIRTGKLRALKLDGSYRLSHDDVGSFLRSREIYLGPIPTGSGAASPPAHAMRNPGSGGS